MKQTTLIFTAALLALASCKDGEHQNNNPADVKDSVVKQLDEKLPEAQPMDSAAQAQAWQTYMTPGDMHKMMAGGDGKWDGEERMWETADAQPSAPMKLTAEFRMVLGGRYQEGVYKGTMMGMPFEGHSWTGYDNARKKLVSTWIDNFGTGMMYSEGTMSEDGKTMTLTGKMTDAVSGKEIECKQVTHITDANHQLFEMYCEGKDGKEFKTMEIKLTRK